MSLSENLVNYPLVRVIHRLSADYDVEALVYSTTEKLNCHNAQADLFLGLRLIRPRRFHFKLGINSFAMTSK